MFHLNKWFYLLTLLLVVCSSMVVAFDFSLCDTPELALAELGDDYYAFCERNIAPDYYSDTPELASQQQIILPKPVTTSTEDSLFLLDEEQSFFRTKSVLIGASIGFFLLVFFVALIIFHQYHSAKAKKDSRQQLRVLIKQYFDAGYTSEQIRQMLLERGYDGAFINELFVTLETSP